MPYFGIDGGFVGAKSRYDGCRLMLLGLVLAQSGSVMAGEEDIYFTSLPVVATVSRLPQKLSEAPGAVTVIDQDMIRASGVRSVADLMRLVPGFQVGATSQDGALVAYHGLSNGMSSEQYTPRVQVLVDGRSLYSPLFKSGVNWNLVPVVLEDIERIEVIRGSNSVSYGSNAFLGVINIITQHSSQASGWMFAANHGNQSISDETLRWGGRVGNADVRFSYHQLGDGGVQKMTSNGWQTSFDPHDSRHSQVLDLRADIPLTDRDELQIALGQSYDISQYGRPNSASDPFRDLNQSSSYFNAEWRRNLAQDQELKLRFAHVEDWMSAHDIQKLSYTPVVGSSRSYFYYDNPDGKSISDEIELEHTFSPWRDARLVWGGSTKRIEIKSPYQFSVNSWKSRSTSRVFSNLEWRPAEAWVINGGASLENDSVVGWLFDPRLSVSYHVMPNHTVRLIASRAHRTPSMYEAFGDVQKTAIGTNQLVDRAYLAVPGIQAERIDSLEFGYLGEFKAINASLDLRAFREKIPNRIQIVPYALPWYAPDLVDANSDRTGGSPRPYLYGRADSALNLEHILTQGYEYQLRWQPFEETRLLYNHSYARIYADLSDYTVVADNVDPNILKVSNQTRESAPRHMTSAMLVQSLPYDFEFSVMYYKSGAMMWRRNSPLSPSERVDWRLAKTFKVGNTRGEVAYVAQMANHEQEVRLNSRMAKEMHWLSLRLEY